MINKETLVSFLIRISEIFFAFLSTVFLTKLLTKKEFGLYVYAYTILTLICNPLSQAFSTLAMREVSKIESFNLVKGLFFWITKLIFIFFFLYMTVTFIIFHIFAIDEIFLISPIFAPIFLLNNMLGSFLRGFNKILIGLLPEFLFQHMFFFLTLFLLYFFSYKLSPLKAMEIRIFSIAISLICSFFLFYKNFPVSSLKAKQKIYKNSWLKEIRTLTLFSLISLFSNKIELIILGLIKTANEVAVYKIATQIAVLFSIGLQIVNRITAPVFSFLYSKGKMIEFQKLAKKNALFAFMFCFILVIIFVLFGKLFIKIVFGINFTEAYYLILILAVGYLINSSVGSVALILNMTNYENLTFKISIITLIINISLSFALIPYLGAKGASIALSSSMIIWNLFLCFLVKKKLNINSFLIGG